MNPVVQTILETAALAVSAAIGGRLFMPMAVFLHEVGHLAAMRLHRIPVHGFTIGQGRRLFELRLFGITWTFNTDVLYGHVEVPSLVPVSGYGWQVIRRLALAGPAANLFFLAFFLACGLLAHAFAAKAILVALAWPHYLCLRMASDDYQLAKAALDQDMDFLARMSNADTSHPPVMLPVQLADKP